MKRPAFQFYPDDWRTNANLRRCSWAARGAWMDVMCLMHDSDRYGVLVWTLKEIAQAIGCPVSLVRELASKGVLKGADVGTFEGFSFTPRSGRRDGPVVVLVPAQTGPVWFSSRMVKDEYLRQVRGESTRFRSAEDPPHDAAPNPSPKGGIGDGFGEGSSDGSPSPSPSPTPLEDKNPSPSLHSGEGSGKSPDGDPPSPPPDAEGKPPEGEGDEKVQQKPPHPPMAVLNEMAAVWNEYAAEHGLAQVREITEQRAIHLRARCRERWTTDPVRQFRAYVARICASPFLRGENDRGWKVDFDWALKPANVVKVAEGKYHDGEGG